MCGIAGLISRHGTSREIAVSMGDAIAHRGPDSRGTWLSDDGRVALSHRRLAIVDLTQAGHQPMVSADTRFVIVYNGEIYNHAELRAQLDAEGRGARPWRGYSDTEILLAGFSAWGVEATLKRARGMFAFALWDHAYGQLTLGRDRFGEKPLYFGWCKAGFAFASELRAIRALPGFDNGVAEGGVAALLQRGYIPAPLSIYQRIFKLPPGALLTVDTAIVDAPLDRLPPGDWQSGGAKLSHFYDYGAVVAEGAANPFASKRDAVAALGRALETAVSGQLMADVPVGLFLSGGIDSSLVTGMAARVSPGRIKTFSMGFDVPGYDEAVYAKAVAAHFGTEHHERTVTAQDARDVIPMLPSIYDEPFADSSQIPTYLVSRFAREHVTVALSGDAGDELFGGYNRHIEFPGLWRKAGAVPRPLRRWGAAGLAALPPSLWNQMARLHSDAARPGFFGHKVQRTLQALSSADDFATMVTEFLGEWPVGETPMLGGALSQSPWGALDLRLSGLPLATQLMHYDAASYLPGDILCKVDRAGMAVSLEGRIPFLDADVAAVAARIPVSMNISGGEGKWVLKDLLYTMAPRALFDRPKAGFAVPVGEWLRTDLRDWAESLLSERALKADGLFDPAPIRRRWTAHLGGGADHTQSLWAVLMLQAWMAEERG